MLGWSPSIIVPWRCQQSNRWAWGTNGRFTRAFVRSVHPEISMPTPWKAVTAQSLPNRLTQCLVAMRCLWLQNLPDSEFRALIPQCKYLPMCFLMIYWDFEHNFVSCSQKLKQDFVSSCNMRKLAIVPRSFFSPRDQNTRLISLNKCQQMKTLNTE